MLFRKGRFISLFNGRIINPFLRFFIMSNSVYRRFPDWYFLLPSVVFLIVIFYKFYLLFPITQFFPFAIGDLTQRLAQLSFFQEYGFFGSVPNWYDGFTLFRSYPPGWFYFTSIFSFFTSNLLVSVYLSLVFIYILSLVAITIFGNSLRLSLTQRVAFFSFFFGSPLLIDQFFNIGKFPEALGWFLLLFLFFFVYYHKDKPISKLSFMVIIPYAALILTHPYETIIGSFLFVPLFILKPWKERAFLGFIILISFLLSSFWFVPFLQSNQDSFSCSFVCSDLSRYIDSPAVKTHSVNPLSVLLTLDSLVSFNTILLVSFFVISLFSYLSSSDKGRFLLFYFPFFVLGFLLISRLLIFVPYFNKVPVNPYNGLFLLLIIALLVTSKFQVDLHKFFFIGIFVFSILSAVVAFTFLNNPDVSYLPYEQEFVDIATGLSGTYLIFPHNSGNINSLIFDSYIGFSRYDLTTPSGGFSPAASEELLVRFDVLRQELESGSCTEFASFVDEEGIVSVISFNEYCPLISSCGFSLEGETKTFCFFSTP